MLMNSSNILKFQNLQMQTEIEWKVHYHEECKKALDAFQNNKAPGEDGFTVEFYTFLFSTC